MSADLDTLDDTTPDGATQPVSVLDDHVRQIKDVLKDWGVVEHDNEGRHKIPYGLTSARPLTSGGSPAIAGTMYFNTQTGVIEIYDGTIWRPVSQKSDSFVYNGSFEKWYDAGHNTPCGWTRGAAFTLTRDTTDKTHGAAALQFARSGTDVVVSQRLDSFWDISHFKDQYITLRCKVKSSVATTAHLGIDTGSGFTWSTANVGTTTEVLQMTTLIPTGATQMTVAVAIRTTNATATFDEVVCVVGYGVHGYIECTYPIRTAILTFDSKTDCSAAATNYFGQNLTSMTEDDVKFRVPFRALIREAYGISSTGSNSYLGNVTFTLRVAGADSHSSAATPQDTDFTMSSNTPKKISAGDYVSMKSTGGTAGGGYIPKVTVAIEEVPL